MSRCRSSLPCSTASSRRPRANHWRILLRARGVATNRTQSWRRPLALGPRGQDLDRVARGELVVEGHQLARPPSRRSCGGRRRCGSRRRSPRAWRPAAGSTTSPLGVKTKTRPPDRSMRRPSMNSRGSAMSLSQSIIWPSHARSAASLSLLGALLVAPVRRDAELRRAVHVARADLDLQRLAARAHDRGVQRLVHVRLGHGDVVLEPAGDRRPQRVHGAQRAVAVAQRLRPARGCPRGRRSR